MALKATLTADEYAALAEPLRGIYTGDASKGYVLDADIEAHPAVAGLKNTVAATRTERDQIKAQLQETVEKYKDIDPAKAREALQSLQKMNDKKLLDEGQIDELVRQKTERMRGDYDNQIKAYDGQVKSKDTEIGKLTGRLEEVLIDSGLRQSAMEAGVKASAVDDVLLRGRRVWRLHDGTPTPYRDGGSDVLFGKDASKPMSMQEWVASLKAVAPHLFEENSGAGGQGSPRFAGSGGKRIVLTREEARDVRRYRAAQDEAKRTGAEVVVQD
jgi:hypothetical protein